MQQVIFAGYYDALNSGATEYNAISTGATWSSTETARQQVISTPGAINNLYVELSADPGTDPDGYRFTLRVNGASSTLTCTITADNTSGSDTAHSVNVVAGDVVGIMCEPLNTPSATPYAQWSMMFTGTEASESLILGFATNNTGSAGYQPIAGASNTADATESNTYQVVATPGKIKNLYVNMDVDPGTAPDAFKFTLRVNGGASTLTCTVTANDKTGNDTAHEVTVAAGDLVDLLVEPLETPSASPIISCGMAFVADTDGESLILGDCYSNPSTSATRYHGITPIYIALWNATEAQQQQLGQVCAIKNLYVYLTVAPGVGKSYAFTTRLNAGATALTCTVSGAATTANDTAHSFNVAASDNLALESVPSGTPATTYAKWGMVCYIAPAGWSNIAKINGITAISFAKVDGIAVASIAKINGVAV